MSAGASSAQTSTFRYESSIGAIPLDVDVNPSGTIATVRSNIPANALPNGNKVSLWDLTFSGPGTGQITLPAGTVGRGNLIQSASPDPVTFANAVAIDNGSAVFIGSADTDGLNGEDTTYVDIVALQSNSAPPTATVLQTHAFSGTTTSTYAGMAHDVAITPDGSTAVVVSRNWIHLFDLTNGGTVRAALNVGGAQSAANAGPCDPGTARNSLDVTDTRAIVTMRRLWEVNGQGDRYYQTWVYVINLIPGVLNAMQEFALEPQPHGTFIEQSPHDLDTTPDGQFALVAANQTLGLFDLGAPWPASSLVVSFLELGRLRARSTNYNSTALSSTRAVVISDFVTTTGSKFYVNVWPLSSTMSFQLGAVAGTNGNQSVGPNGGWDVHLSTDGKVAAVKGFATDLMVLNVDATPQFFETGTSASSVPCSGSWGSDMNSALVVLPSYYDPVVLGSNGTGLHRWVGFAGRRPGRSVLNFWDVGQFAGSATPLVDFDLHDPAFVLPTNAVDLQSMLGQTHVTLRNTAPPDETNPAAGGQDWFHFTTRPPTLVSSGSGSGGLGGKGTCVGEDNLRGQRGVSVSISQNVQSPTPAGWIHVVNVN